MADAILIFGGEILTLDPVRPRAEALLVRGGEVAALGTLTDLESAAQGASRLDLRGRTLLPSLKDHHVHVLNVGFAVHNRAQNEKLFLDLTAAQSEAEVAARVAGRAKHLAPGEWIFGASWNQRLWGTEQLPGHESLTQAAPQNPVFLVRVDAHCAWVNAAALAAAGISRATQDPPGGAILRAADGSPTGILLERAVEPLLEEFSQPAEQEIREAIRAGVRALAAQGITDVYDAGFLPFPGIVGMNLPLEPYLRILQELDAAESLPVRVHLMVPWPTSLAEKILEGKQDLAITKRLRVTHIKLFADGALGSRGAALGRPYADDPSMRGVFRMSAEEIQNVTRRAIRAGLDVATHAIGDEAVTRTLDAYAAVLKSDPEINPRRLRLEHFSVAKPDELHRVARLGICLSIQPGFIIPDADGRIMEDHRLGANFQEAVYPWASLEKLGAVLAGGSDDFTVPNHPLWGFYTATTRKNSNGQPSDGWHPQEKLSRDAGLRLFTDFYLQGGVVARGMLRKGVAADFVVLSENPLAAEESKILNIRVHATLLAGQLAFTDGSLQLP
ncbi:MAG TPA: amidohydrolase [Candidatus Nitrosotenuis sp.]|nr:amidohydrolase [Candidatus Nitrosotenuis sp.]